MKTTRFNQSLAMAWVFVGTLGLGASVVRAASSVPFSDPMILSNLSQTPGVVEVNLSAGKAKLPLTDGKLTEVFAYNGMVPGPTIEAFEGDLVKVHFKNQLQEPTTVHWHGLHIPANQDGNPMDPVPPGGTRDYVFTIPGGSAGTYWYHPHAQGLTASQVAMGLVGSFVVRSKDDPIAENIPEHVVMLTDNRFDSNSQVDPSTDNDRMNGREGNIVFVNGQRLPLLSVNAGEVHRFRVINGSSAKYYLLNLPRHTLLQVGSDGGLFEKPVPTSQVLVTPGERVELLVKFGGAPGTSVTLQSLPYDRGVMQMDDMAPEMNPIPLFQIQYSSKTPVKGPTIPAQLRSVPPLATNGAIQRNFKLSESMMDLDFRINGKKFDMNRVDVRSKLGSTEVWTVENNGDMDHPFHLHGFQFQVLTRNGAAEPFKSWKDTVNITKGGQVQFAVKFDDFKGPRMYHCHILDHEDLGMMGNLLIE